jgi:peptidyl-prolyl cis-trans isomerase A (cyclophilin A)
MKHLLTIMFVCGAAFAQTKSTAAKSTTPVKKAAAPARNLLDPSTMKSPAPAVFKAKFTTTQGDFIVQVTRAWAPLGADRFYNLVRAGFFTGAPFFRVIPGFMAQFGISIDPKVSAAWSSQNLVDDPVKESNKRGFISFATSGPNSRTTQVFINYGDNSRLDSSGFAPFGEVIEGMDVVEKFYSGYGETANQGPAIQQMGQSYLDKNLPKVDRTKTAVIVPLTPPAPAATKSTATKSTTPAKSTTTTKQ